MTDASTGVPTTGGLHCETTALGALLGHAGVRLSEPLLFGLGAGLSFLALYGYDDDTAYLLDTAQQGGRVTTSLDSLARARAARGPMSAPHRSFTLGLPGEPVDVASAVVPAIVECAEAFLDPPIANIGYRGIRTTATRAPSWFDRVEDPRRDLPLMALLMERAGTGGALFRNLYRDFLTDCLPLLDAGGAGGSAATPERGRDLFDESATLWTGVADLVERAGLDGDPGRLSEAAELLAVIADRETAAMTALRSL